MFQTEINAQYFQNEHQLSWWFSLETLKAWIMKVLVHLAPLIASKNSFVYHTFLNYQQINTIIIFHNKHILNILLF